MNTHVSHPLAMRPEPVRVLVVDDSFLMRQVIIGILEQSPYLEVVGEAVDGVDALACAEALCPDVILLDIEMPGEDGLTFLDWLMKNEPVPVVISSSYSSRGADQTMRAFSLGAVEVVCKGNLVKSQGWEPDFSEALLTAVTAAARARQKNCFRRAMRPARESITGYTGAVASRKQTDVRAVVIGASTGGTEAIAQLISAMPPDFPPTLIVKHMPALYTHSFARRLDSLGAVQVREASHGDTARRGEVLIAPGGKQMRMERGHAGPVAVVTDEPPVNRHAPSVDVLFESAALQYRERVIGILLTGMGNDGAQGLLRIREAGGMTIGQNEASSVVYGMAHEAKKLNATVKELPLEKILQYTVDVVIAGHAD